MIERDRLQHGEGVDLYAVAPIAVPVPGCEGQDVEFEDEELAVFVLPGRHVCGLMRYLHSPDPDLTQVPKSGPEAEAAFLSMVATISAAFDVPISAFHWRANGEPVVGPAVLEYDPSR